jgi:hypothetical protein
VPVQVLGLEGPRGPVGTVAEVAVLRYGVPAFREEPLQLLHLGAFPVSLEHLCHEASLETSSDMMEIEAVKGAESFHAPHRLINLYEDPECGGNNDVNEPVDEPVERHRGQLLLFERMERGQVLLSENEPIEVVPCEIALGEHP